MGQAEIMNFLDENKGSFFSVREIHEELHGKINHPKQLRNTYRAVKKIMKRDEYTARLLPPVGPKDRGWKAIYGAENEVN